MRDTVGETSGVSSDSPGSTPVPDASHGSGDAWVSGPRRPGNLLLVDRGGGVSLSPRPFPAAMVVTVDQIREGGLSLDETLSESFLTHTLAEVKDTGFRPDGPARLHVRLQKTGSGVLLRGSTE